VGYFLTYWLFLPQIWVALGLVLVLLELTDGSAIFFLPMGLASFLLALMLFGVNNDFLPHGLLPNAWYWLLSVWIAVSVIVSFLLSNFRKSRMSKPDINDY